NLHWSIPTTCSTKKALPPVATVTPTRPSRMVIADDNILLKRAGTVPQRVISPKSFNITLLPSLVAMLRNRDRPRVKTTRAGAVVVENKRTAITRQRRKEMLSSRLDQEVDSSCLRNCNARKRFVKRLKNVNADAWVKTAMTTNQPSPRLMTKTVKRTTAMTRTRKSPRPQEPWPWTWLTRKRFGSSTTSASRRLTIVVKPWVIQMHPTSICNSPRWMLVNGNRLLRSDWTSRTRLEWSVARDN
ncbi:hypothetical protein BGW38_005201, partial [Lunasporangiospora selenospora]